MTRLQLTAPVLALVAITWAPLLPLGAQDLLPVNDLPAAVPVTSPEAATVKLVVLTDGRVFTGKLSEIAGGYRVDLNGTFHVLPYEEVKVLAGTLAEAYAKLQATLTNPTAVDHIRLSEWCLRNGLLGEARQEVIRALELEPLRSDAHALLRKIAQAAPPTASSPGGPIPQVPPRTPPAAEQLDQGLSRETVQTFIRQVQPLLQNKCGNANCHGRASTNSFRLSGSRSTDRNHRLSSEQNLAAVLGQIAKDQPAASRLLAKPSEPTAEHKAVFQGSLGASQYQILLEWVVRAAAEMKPSSPAPLPAVAASPLLIEPASNWETSPPPSGREFGSVRYGTIPGVAGANDSSAERTSSGEMPPPESTLSSKTLRAILHQTAPDPFDPAEFNRMMHGSAAPAKRGD